SRPELPDLSSRRAPADLDARKAERRAYRNRARIRRMSLGLGGGVLAGGGGLGGVTRRFTFGRIGVCHQIHNGFANYQDGSIHNEPFYGRCRI
ncbi:hypothetical protein, partial [Neoactinobaculum massilliense]|uniref:hypothetical protein n=1 Tax=Neoactinobaculum massilliense TaxID=2364794 RepID=UPI0019D05A1E